jgi:cell division protein ZapA
MSAIKVSILGKSYPLRVLEGEEELMQRVAGYVDDRFKIFQRELTNQSEQTIMVLACLSIAEELFSERKKNAQLTRESDAETIAQDDLGKISDRIQQLLRDIDS